MPKSTDFRARVNGKTYSWVDISFTIAGQNVSGITAISYSREREKENVYASGSEPVAVSHGQRKYEASISMLKSELDALKRAAPLGVITDIPAFALPVLYVNDEGTFTRDTLNNFEFTKESNDFKVGDKGLEVKLECIISGFTTTFS
jgi:hypothetical protein